MLLIDNDVTTAVLNMKDVITVLEQAYRDLAAGNATCRPRIDMRFPIDGSPEFYQWGTMEGGSAASGYYAIRMKSDICSEVEYAGTRVQERYCVKPGTFCGLVFLLSSRTGEPLAILNDGVLQHMRVAADSAIGAKYAAREDAHVLGMLGSGGMARSHLDALATVRQLNRVNVFSPTRENAERYAAEMSDKHGINVSAVATPRDVFRGADIVSGCTDSVGEVIIGEWLEPGTHITCIGGRLDARACELVNGWLELGTAPPPLNDPSWCRTDEYLAYAARPEDPVWAQQKHVSGSRLPKGVRSSRNWISLGEVRSGTATVRKSNTDITFSERGNIQGAQFFAVAGLIYELAQVRGLGRELPTEWFLQSVKN